MSCPPKLARASRRLRSAPGRVTLLTAVAALALAGVALAKTLTLAVGKHGTVINQSSQVKHEAIVIFRAAGQPVYYLTGDSKKHPECTNTGGCLANWPPVTSLKATKARHIAGRLGKWRRNGFTQVTLNGHPLYIFAFDSRGTKATGEGISMGAHETWHVLTPTTFKHKKKKGSSSSSPPPSSPPPGW